MTEPRTAQPGDRLTFVVHSRGPVISKVGDDNVSIDLWTADVDKIAAAQPQPVTPFTRDPEERIQELLEANNRYQQDGRDARAESTAWERAANDAAEDVQTLSKEAECLRLIVANTAKALGAHIAPSASIDFMGKLPDEAALKMNLHRDNVGAYQAREHSVYEILCALGLPDLRRESIARAVQTAATRLTRAERALRAAGYTDEGGQDWRPPVSRIRMTAASALDALRPFADSISTVGDSWSDQRGRHTVGGRMPTIGDYRQAAAAYSDLVQLFQDRPAIRWIDREGIEPNDAVFISHQSRVWIATEHGIWRFRNERGGANGYTDNPVEADTWTGAEAWAQTSHCGPEKKVRFGVPIAPVDTKA
jgi:hypothetical protein